MATSYDLIIIGGGSGGITAAKFGASLGARVALIEKNRIGGDCTWTGCIPSKALLKVAKVAHTVRQSEAFGVETEAFGVNMEKVRSYLRQASADVYRFETPEALAQENIEVIHGAARFVDERSVDVDGQRITFGRAIICTGARPLVPSVPGLDAVPYDTTEQLFENDVLPERLTILGAGSVGAEIAQAYQRLGSMVTLVDHAFLPNEEPEASHAIMQVFQHEGIRFVQGLASKVRIEQDQICIDVADEVIHSDRLLVATGRLPNVDGLGLEAAGISYSRNGIVVDRHLRTSAKQIYAAGDCTGGYQFTHYAGWQGFQAARNALLPGHAEGISETVPRTLFTDPELAHIGRSEAEARSRYGDKIRATSWGNERVDRAVCDGQTAGFVKIVHRPDGTILGATVVSERAGEVITEFALAMKHGLKLRDVAETLHVYPTYAMPVMQLSADIATQDFLQSWPGRLAKKFSKIR